MAYYDELKFAGIVNEQARQLVAEIVSGRVDLAQRRAFGLCTFAANRHSTLLVAADLPEPSRYDLAALAVDMDTLSPEHEK